MSVCGDRDFPSRETTLIASNSRDPPKRASISVAVPTRARAALLDECLSSILSQSLPASEIVISEDGEDGETRRWCAAVKPLEHRSATSEIFRHSGNSEIGSELFNSQRAISWRCSTTTTPGVRTF